MTRLLLLAWGSPEIEVHALTTVSGNVAVERPPGMRADSSPCVGPGRGRCTAMGASAPLARPGVTATHYHGEDGLGDAGSWPMTAVAPTSIGAVELMVRIARHYGPSLSIIALGPLTNVALALRADPEAMAESAGSRSWGARSTFRVMSRRRRSSTFTSTRKRQRMCSRQGCRSTSFPSMSPARSSSPVIGWWQRSRQPRGHSANRIAAFTASAFRAESTHGQPGMALHDPLAVGTAVVEHFVEWESLRLQVGPDGETRRSPGAPNCRAAMHVDGEAFLATFLDRLAPRS